MRLCRLLLGAALLTLVASCGTLPPLGGVPPVSLPEPTPYGELEARVYGAVNEHRTEIGLPLLTYNAEVARLAREHSERMAGGVVGIGHEGFQVRGRQAFRAIGGSGAGENVSRHKNRSEASIPSAALERWLESPGHLKNVVGSYRYTGVGVASDAVGTIYMTQLFAR